VQGHLLNRTLRGRLRTACAHCERPIEIELDSDLRFRVLSEGAQPVVSSPRVDFGALEDPSIIHAF